MSDFTTKYENYQISLGEAIENHESIIKQLRTFLLQRKDIQSAIFNDLFTHYLQTWRTLEDIINDEINRDTVMQHDAEINEMIRKQEEDFYGNGKHSHR